MWEWAGYYFDYTSHIRAIPEKNTWEGKTAGDIFFYGWLVRKVFKLYGLLVFDQIKLKILWPCSLAVPVLAGWVCAFVVLCPGTPEGSTGSGSGFKTSQKTGQRLKVSSEIKLNGWLVFHQI